MNKNELRRKAQDPGYVSGIYNYCDRWCERCNFTSRCLNYSISEEEFGDPKTRDIRNEAFWEKLHSIFEQTKEMLQDMAKEMGIDLGSMDTESVMEEQKCKRRDAKEHELARAAYKYISIVNEWFNGELFLFEDKKDELHTMASIGLDESKIKAEADDIADAIEVIQWYQHQIYVKLMRALCQGNNDDEEMDEVLKMDSNGSAKVALIGMDRSIGAWGKLQDHFPGKTDAILDILLSLDRLRRKTEKEFPDARAFKRPGFDVIDRNSRT